MRIFWLGILSTLLLPAAAFAQSPAITWTQFVDPTENAFGAAVPQGWTVSGGVTRLSPLDAPQWMTVASPDRTTEIFIGDPGLTAFVLPKPNQPEGVSVPPLSSELRPAVTMNYRPGAEFAKFYGPKSLAAANCLNATLVGSGSMPDLAKAQFARATEMSRGLVIVGTFKVSQHDAGFATFSCQAEGQTFAAGIVADTAQPLANYWSAPAIAGYITTPGQETSVQAILQQILASRQYNPQWDAAMHEEAQKALDQQNKADQKMMADLTQYEKQSAAMLFANGQQQQAALTAAHNATMAQMNQQSAARNAQFRTDEAQKGLNAWKFEAYIRNGQLYQNPQTGKYFEVDH